MNFDAVVRKAFSDTADAAEHKAKKELKSVTKDVKKEIKHEVKDVKKDIKKEVRAGIKEELGVDVKELKHEVKDVKKEVKGVKKDVKKINKAIDDPSASSVGGAAAAGGSFLNRFKKSAGGGGGGGKEGHMSSSPSSSTSRSATTEDGGNYPPLPPHLGCVEKEGWLTKQGQKVKSWRERWFKLDALGYLHYYKGVNEVAPLDSLWLEGAEVKVEEGLKRAGFNFSVQLAHPKPRVLYLSARSADERREWMEAILVGTNNAQSMLSSSPTSSQRKNIFEADGSDGEDGEKSRGSTFSQREPTFVDLPDIKEGEESDEEEAAGEDEKVLLAKTLLSKSMWGPADIQELEKTGLLVPSEEPTAFSSWYGVVGLTVVGSGATRNVAVADASEGTFAWCSLRLRGRISVIGKDEVLKTDDAGELEVVQQTLTSPVKQFLCENKEGWMFYVYVSPTDKQNRPKKEKGRETISLPRIKMAADTKKEMEDWSRFLWDRGLEGRRKQMINGFLWIKKAKVWQRYYCIADAHYFEWFEPQKFRAIPIADLTVTGPESGRVNRPKQKSTSFHVRNVLENYNHSLTVTDGKKMNICLYTADDEHLNYWNRVLSRKHGASSSSQPGKEMLMLSCAAGYAGAAVNGLSATAEEPKKGLMSEQGSAKVNTRTSSPVTELINSARLLCEKANQATGKSSLGNYPLENIGSKDGQYRILSLDGGGLRAVMEAVILTRLTEVYPDLLQKFDLIVGVSGGSMVTAGLATGRSPHFLTEMFKVIGPICFKQKAASVQWFSLNQAKFPREPLEVFGAEVFKGMKLCDLPRKVVIPSFLLDNEAPGNDRSWEPRIYHNLPMKAEYEAKEGAWKEQELWKCVLSSSAAPIYFPSHGKHMDGAVMVNNPALSALSMVMSEKVVERQDPSRIHMLSLGTGRMVQFVEGDNLDWGMIQWAPKLPELIVKAGLLHQEEMVRLMLGERFHQCNPLMEKFLDMDNAALIPDLIALANTVDLAPTLAWIDVHLYNGQRQPTSPTTTTAEPIPVPTSAATSKDMSYADAVAAKSATPPKDLSCDLSAWYSAPLQMSTETLAQEE